MQKKKTTVFTRYFNQLYNPPVNADRELVREYEMESGEEDGIPVSEMEVNGALRAMRNRKAAGICGILPELLKYGGAGMISEMTNLFNMIMEEKRLPVE